MRALVALVDRRNNRMVQAEAILEPSERTSEKWEEIACAKPDGHLISL